MTSLGQDTDLATGTPVRDRIRVAAAELAVELGWRRVRMAAVASRAGVSRQTVYDQFATKDGLARGILAAEVERILALLTQALWSGTDPERSMRAAVEVVLEDCRHNTLLPVVLDQGPNGDPELLRLLTSDAAPVYAAIWQAIAPWGAHTYPTAPITRMANVVDVVGRVVVSHLVQPGPDGLDVAGTVAEMVTRYMAEFADS